jgi:hypothetical protein
MWIAEKDYRRYDRKNKVDRRSFVGIEEFIKKHQPKGKKSKLYPFLDNILRLQDLGYSQEQICLYLETEEGISVTQAGLSRFLSQYGDTSKRTSPSKSAELKPGVGSSAPSAPSYFEKTKKPEVDIDDVMQGE